MTITSHERTEISNWSQTHTLIFNYLENVKLTCRDSLVLCTKTSLLTSVSLKVCNKRLRSSALLQLSLNTLSLYTLKYFQ